MRYFAPIIAVVYMSAALGLCVWLDYDIKQSAALIGSARDQVAAIAARDTFAKTAAQFLAQTSAERSAIQFFLTPAEGTASAIELVEDAAAIAKVSASVGSASLVPLSQPHHERLDIAASADSTFAGAARFATVLESLPRASYLKEVRLESTDKGWYGTYVVAFIKVK